MIAQRNLSADQVRYAVDHGEFGNDVLEANRNVAVVMTQSWCLQWVFMKRWIEREAEIGPEAATTPPGEPSILVFVLVYDTEPFFREFLGFKERHFGNAQVPYVRYYRDGKLLQESNYLPRKRFVGVFTAGADAENAAGDETPVG